MQIKTERENFRTMQKLGRRRLCQSQQLDDFFLVTSNGKGRFSDYKGVTGHEQLMLSPCSVMIIFQFHTVCLTNKAM